MIVLSYDCLGLAWLGLLPCLALSVLVVVVLSWLLASTKKQGKEWMWAWAQTVGTMPAKP